ncbi:MAG TPA: PD-(D/E)XK nuclease family protein [Candidatus Paceibacterota bacterium]|nr:PD-(D/E)XK nuclease family protein [Candidatus Paceibacterota bacterium]
MNAYRRAYNPNRSAEWNYGGPKWRLSRSKIDLFHECPRCFYLDNKLGTKRPSFPSFNLNIAVDELFKKEFDVHRADQTPHPVMQEYSIDAVPFSHAKLDLWRDNFSGVETTHTPTNLVVCGAVDDIWLTRSGSLIIVDYKSTSKEGTISQLSDSSWDQQYKRQLGVYSWLLQQNGFTVEETGYLVYANARKDEPGFDNTLVFETTLVPVTLETDWIEPALHNIKDCLEQETFPAPGAVCEYCPYREAAGKKLLAIHNAQKNGT